MMRILFVCTGNTCRSPMAEGLMRRLAQERGVNVEVRSAGVAAMQGATISPHAQTILRAQGVYDVPLATRLDADQVQWADLILTLTGRHKDYIHQYFPKAQSKTYILQEYIAQQQRPQNEQQEDSVDFDILDPYGGSIQDYQVTAAQIESALHRLLHQL